MRIVISIKSADYRQYNNLIEALKGQDITELICIKNELVRRYAKEFNKPLQEFIIAWRDIRGVPAEDIAEDKSGTPYDKKAAVRTAEKVVEYGEAIVVIGQGDYNINKLGEERNLQVLNTVQTKKKKFKF